MAWNPSPRVADCREIARRWNREQVIILALDGEGRLDWASYGKDMRLCKCAGKLAEVAEQAVSRFIRDAESQLSEKGIA